MLSIAIVLVTLLAATTAWLQAVAGRDDDEAAVRAERLASQTLGTVARSKSLAELRIQREQLADERARRAVALRRQRAYGIGDAGRDEGAGARLAAGGNGDAQGDRADRGR